MRERGFEPLQALSQQILSLSRLTAPAPPLIKKFNNVGYKKLYKCPELVISEDGHSSLETPVPI